MTRDVFHLRLQMQKRQNIRHRKPAQSHKAHPQSKSPIKALLDDKADFFLFTGTIKLGNSRRKPRYNSQKTAEKGHKEINAHSHARQILLADMSGHHRIKKPCCH